MSPHCVIEAQLVIGNIQRNPRPATTSLKQFYKLIQPSFEKNVQGSFSQGDPKFGHSAGLQCVAMSLYAAAFSCLKQITRWSDKTLDSILEKGNDLFNLINKDRYLGVDDLPGQVNIFDAVISISYNFNVHGMLSHAPPNRHIFKQHFLQNKSPQLQNRTLLCLSNTCIYLHIQGFKKEKYIVFDSHPRDSMGLTSENGTSVLMTFIKFDDLMEYFCYVYLDKRNISEIPYQIQSVTCSCPLLKQRQQQLIRKHKSSSELNARMQLKRLKLSLETSNQTLLRLEKHRIEVKLHRNNQSSEQKMLRLQKHQSKCPTVHGGQVFRCLKKYCTEGQIL